jgi:hypothetical protein
MKRPKKYEDKLFIDMPLGEALERFIGVDPKELQANIDKSKKRKPPGSGRKEPPGGTDVGDDAQVVRLRDRRKRHHG